MASPKKKQRAGFTLVEVMLATVIFIIAVLGTSAYRYSAALSARRADLQTAAARTALLLCEGWRGVGGSTAYDPSSYFNSDLTIDSEAGPPAPDAFVSIGGYKVMLEGNAYFVTLSYHDVGTGLRALNVVVGYDQAGKGANTLQEANKFFKLTTYVEI